MIEPVSKAERKTSYYVFEKIPGLIFWLLLIFLLLGGSLFPEITAYAILTLNVFFLYRSATFALFLYISFLRVREGENLDWRSKLNTLLNPVQAIETIQAELKILKESGEQDYADKLKGKIPKIVKWLIARQEVRKIKGYLHRQIVELSTLDMKYDWQELQHIIIIPHVKEPEHILRETLDNLRAQSLPSSQINIVLAAEARDPNGLPLSEKLAAEYKQFFNHIWVSNHVLSDEEIVGKSSNMKAAGKVAYEEVLKLGWDLKKVLVTSCDADSKLPAQYLSYVSYKYVTTPEGEFKFYNAAMVFYNNIWRLPFYARVKNSMSSLYNTARLVRTDKLVPFSTYTTSFWLVKEIGFWTPWITPEDFHLFFKAQFKFGAAVSVVPVYLRIFSDAAEGKGHFDTIKNNYMQERRWSWGISDDGWVLQNIFANLTKLELITIYRGLHSVFDHIIGPVMGVVLLIGGNLPPLLNPEFNRTVLGATLPSVSSTIITLSLVFLVVVISLDYLLKPSRKLRFWPLSIVISLAEWLVLPWAGFVLAVLPGVEANTRLLFGKYLEYYVTQKH